MPARIGSLCQSQHSTRSSAYASSPPPVMTFSPPSSLATAQHFGHAGRDVPLFQPPKSPASVTASPAFATAQDYFGSRKRQRPISPPRYRDERHATSTGFSWTHPSNGDQNPFPASGSIFSSTFGQNSGLVNEDYRLAGGFDTPSALQSTPRLEQLTINEHEFRRRLRDEDMGVDTCGDGAPIFGPLGGERNGIARLPSPLGENPQTSWTGFAFGLVGKVFTFGTSMVRGFYAGGGKGYDLNNNYPLVGSDLLQGGSGGCLTPVPGAWHQDEFLGDFEQDSPAFMTSQAPSAPKPPNKRRQTDRDTWVLVGTSELEITPASPKRKVSGGSVPRSNLASRPSASRASSRRSIAPTPRRGNSYVSTNGSPAHQQLQQQQKQQQQQQQQQKPPPPHFTAPQPLSHVRRASIAPTRSPPIHPSMSNSFNGPMSPEAERYAKRQARQDRATDKAMNSMGRRMEDLIRQAQEALGTKVSIEGDGMELEDEGFVDEDW